MLWPFLWFDLSRSQSSRRPVVYSSDLLLASGPEGSILVSGTERSEAMHHLEKLLLSTKWWRYEWAECDPKSQTPTGQRPAECDPSARPPLPINPDVSTGQRSVEPFSQEPQIDQQGVAPSVLWSVQALTRWVDEIELLALALCRLCLSLLLCSRSLKGINWHGHIFKCQRTKVKMMKHSIEQSNNSKT